MMSESYSVIFSNTLPSDHDLCWSVGDPVIAKFFLDSKWYRATILKVRFSIVFLIDFWKFSFIYNIL